MGNIKVKELETVRILFKKKNNNGMRIKFGKKGSSKNSHDDFIKKA